MVINFLSFLFMQLLDPAEDDSGIQAMESEYSKDPYLNVEYIDRLMNYYPSQIPRSVASDIIVRHEYVKLNVGKKKLMLIYNATYNKLKQKIEKFYGCSIFDVQCNTLFIRPDPTTNTHYYFQLERDPLPSGVGLRLVGWFHCPFPNIKLAVNCPFSDSMYSHVTNDGRAHLLLPWYEQAGKDISPENFDTDAVAPEANMIIPFMGQDVKYGMYLFTGIHDTVAFQCTVLVNKSARQEAIDKEQFRRTSEQQRTPWKRSHKKTPRTKIIRQEHIPRYMLHNPSTGIGYEIPSQDIEFDPEDGLCKI